jgi:hypothetical protein
MEVCNLNELVYASLFLLAIPLFTFVLLGILSFSSGSLFLLLIIDFYVIL